MCNRDHGPESRLLRALHLRLAHFHRYKLTRIAFPFFVELCSYKPYLETPLTQNRRQPHRFVLIEHPCERLLQTESEECLTTLHEFSLCSRIS